MLAFCFRGRALVGLFLVMGLMAAGLGWCLLERSDTIAFLPARSGAEWIIQPDQPDNLMNPNGPIPAVFTRTFNLDSPVTGAELSLCAFTSAGVVINGREVAGLDCHGKNWKLPAMADISSLLQTGSNTITVCVTNTFGPPALWLRIRAGSWSLGSDASWLMAQSDGAWQQARPASEPVEIPAWSPFGDRWRTADSLHQLWPLLALSGLMSLALIAGVNRWLHRQKAESRVRAPEDLMRLLAVAVIVIRAALFINNQWELPTQTGFDNEPHEQYIRYIQDHKALPLPDQGWEMYQPPLYYAGSALVLSAAGLTAGEPNSDITLHTINGSIGLLECWLAFLCLQRLFPKNYPAQSVGLLVAAFLPPNLFLSQYVTNEPLTALFTTLALYYFLRLLTEEKASPRLPLFLGLALGAALLSKVSALLAVMVLLSAAAWWLVAKKELSLKNRLRGTGVMLLACMVVCGWYYGWIWAHYGRPIVGNWESDVGTAWWQEPGFTTRRNLTGFGLCLTAPLFSGFNSFPDGIYSTLWGDGLISGTSDMLYRPPWNYDLMNVSYLLALALTLMAITGFAAALWQGLCQSRLDWLVIAGMVAIYTVGILYMTLKVPSYAQAKAFYGFPALVPFSALVALGWTWLAQKSRGWQAALGTIILVWALTAGLTFWIRGNNSETWRRRALMELRQTHPQAAIDYFSRALQLNPDDFQCHRFMALALLQLHQTAAAAQQCETALQLCPDNPAILNEVASFLIGGPDGRAQRAVKLCERACELTTYRQSKLVYTLAVAYARADQRDAAMIAAQKTCHLAMKDGDSSLYQKSQALMARLRQPATSK